jgi:hypothetical protein
VHSDLVKMECTVKQRTSSKSSASSSTKMKISVDRLPPEWRTNQIASAIHKFPVLESSLRQLLRHPPTAGDGMHHGLLASIPSLTDKLASDDALADVRPELVTSARTLSAVCEFLSCFPPLRDLIRPLQDLRTALVDLSRGAHPPLLSTVPKGRRVTPLALQDLMACAAITMDVLMVFGKKSRPDAASLVARELRNVRTSQGDHFNIVTKTTVSGWRDRLIEGAGSMPTAALHQWQVYQQERHKREPDEGPDDIIERAMNGLKRSRDILTLSPSSPNVD